jgi:ribose 5-phosphate isomerase B
MKIAFGCDHAGYHHREAVIGHLQAAGYTVIDFGCRTQESCDYPDIAAAVARSVADGTAEKGVLICGTGIGMSIAANKVQGIRAALGVSVDEVRLTRAHNDANVLTLGAKYLEPAEAGELVEAFLSTGFEQGRHQRRLAKVSALERNGSGTLEENLQ